MILHPSQLFISQLLIYPIKSLGGISLQQSQVTSRGLQYDRRFMLVDENNRFVSQREFPLMALLKVTIEDDRLIVYPLTDVQNKCVINLNVTCGDEIKVQIWEDTCEALLVDKQADEWFSDRLGKRVRLVYMPENSKRYVDEDYALKNDLTSFSDGFPILIIGQASMNELNNRLELPVGIDRFRPNLVFTGGTPFMEDEFRHFQCGAVNLFAVKPCARCSMTTNDPLTAVVGQEPLKTLSGFRKGNNKIYFGQNVLVGNEGMLSLGDELKIVDTKLPVVLKS